MEQQKYLSFNTLIENGYLQEANRQFFHPLGLALTVVESKDKPPLLMVIDERDSLEGITFSYSENDEDKKLRLMRALNVLSEFELRSGLRQHLFQVDSYIQPITSL